MSLINIKELLLEAFRTYPLRPRRLDDIQEQLFSSLLMKDMEFKHEFGNLHYVGFYVSKMGRILKDRFTSHNKNIYRLCFYPYNILLEAESDDYISMESNNKEILNTAEEAIIMYLLSKGKNKSLVPLLVNIFPEFCMHVNKI